LLRAALRLVEPRASDDALAQGVVGLRPPSSVPGALVVPNKDAFFSRSASSEAACAAVAAAAASATAAEVLFFKTRGRELNTGD